MTHLWEVATNFERHLIIRFRGPISHHSTGCVNWMRGNSRGEPSILPFAGELRGIGIWVSVQYPEIWIFIDFGALTQLFQGFAVPPGRRYPSREG